MDIEGKVNSMTTEDKLKNLILSKYGSVRKFTQQYDLPYSTVATLFSRGIKNTSVATLIKVCQILGISADELLAGRITYINGKTEPTRIEDYIMHLQHQLQNTENLTLNDQPVDDASIDSIIKSLDILIEIEKKNINKYLKN